MRHVIGIDAGGTKTVGLLATDGGEVVREARAGGANLRLHGELGVEKTLFQILESLDAPAPAAAACLGMAGVDRGEEREVVRGVLRRLGLRQAVRVENDAFVALVAGAPEGSGIVVVSGTGSIAYGVSREGTAARSGGWGYLLGDEGSAFWIGHAAVRLGIRAADGRGVGTSLFERICDRLDLKETAELGVWFYDQEHSRDRVARLAEVVEEAATAGDRAADELLDQAAEHLARAARAVERELGFKDSFPLVLAGGAFRACPSLYERLDAVLELPAAKVVRLTCEPAHGAVRLALELLR